MIPLRPSDCEAAARTDSVDYVFLVSDSVSCGAGDVRCAPLRSAPPAGVLGDTDEPGPTHPDAVTSSAGLRTDLIARRQSKP